MLTAGDIQFEPPQPKVSFLTRSIAVMYSGDSALAAEVLQLVREEVRARVDAEPHNWWGVRDVAYLWAERYREMRLLRAEAAILAPLGLDRSTYLTNVMSTTLLENISTELVGYEAPDVFTIVTGVDPIGAHIYVTDNGTVTCHDLVGFAAIGAGYWHADSLLMFAGHTRASSLDETLFLTYSAKRRAEVAPGVGEGTDMFLIGPGLGTSSTIAENIITDLGVIHKKQQQAVRRAAKRAETGVKNYVENLSKSTSVEQQSAPPQEAGEEASAAEIEPAETDTTEAH